MSTYQHQVSSIVILYTRKQYRLGPSRKKTTDASS